MGNPMLIPALCMVAVLLVGLVATYYTILES